MRGVHLALLAGQQRRRPARPSCGGSASARARRRARARSAPPARPSAITAPARSTAMRSARPSASSMSCVIITRGEPQRLVQAPGSPGPAHRASADRGRRTARPSARSRGAAAKARATPTRWRSPPDSWCGSRAARSSASSRTSSSSSSTRARHARLVPAEQLRRDGDVLRHRHVREQADLLEHVADAPAQRDRVERAPHRCRRCATIPELGSDRRLIRRSSVVLPEPEAPTTARNSPGRTERTRRRARPGRHRSAW